MSIGKIITTICILMGAICILFVVGIVMFEYLKQKRCSSKLKIGLVFSICVALVGLIGCVFWNPLFIICFFVLVASLITNIVMAHMEEFKQERETEEGV